MKVLGLSLLYKVKNGEKREPEGTRGLGKKIEDLLEDRLRMVRTVAAVGAVDVRLRGAEGVVLVHGRRIRNISENVRSFSAVSAPIFPSKYAFCSIF